jgi:hypothetical protein
VSIQQQSVLQVEIAKLQLEKQNMEMYINQWRINQYILLYIIFCSSFIIYIISNEYYKWVWVNYMKRIAANIRTNNEFNELTRNINMPNIPANKLNR